MYGPRARETEAELERAIIARATRHWGDFWPHSDHFSPHDSQERPIPLFQCEKFVPQPGSAASTRATASSRGSPPPTTTSGDSGGS
jgi:hypothetical protein